MPPESATKNFRESLRGQSFCPGEPGYDTARTFRRTFLWLLHCTLGLIYSQAAFGPWVLYSGER